MEAVIWVRVEGKKKYVGSRWSMGGVHVSKTKPSVRDNEIAVRLTLNIPDAVFEEPVFVAKLSLPEMAKEFPSHTEVVREVQNVLSERMGFRVKLDIPRSEIEEK